ncbi:hypothetical protein HHE06_16790 [Helicobacter heilmannii]|nr:hypothetical protein HHE014_08160 [Helicobacter heilmannii]CRF51775.1 hypothetical protein HHE06_16790 [Helicobacter heilmannii]
MASSHYKIEQTIQEREIDMETLSQTQMLESQTQVLEIISALLSAKSAGENLTHFNTAIVEFRDLTKKNRHP